jgi:hypothetical protein
MVPPGQQRQSPCPTMGDLLSTALASLWWQGGRERVSWRQKQAATSNIQHRLLERFHDAHTGNYTPEERARKVIPIDGEGKKYMKHAEILLEYQILLNSLFSQSFHLATASPGILLITLVPQRESKELRKSEACSTAL